MSNHVWLTADLHFGCENVLKYRYRPFNSVREMNEEMVKNWNMMIEPEDTVYFLGDFAVTDEALEMYAPRLNGEIHMVMGNHDHNRSKKRLMSLFKTVAADPFLLDTYYNIDNYILRHLWLCHYPLQRHPIHFTCSAHVHNLFTVAINMVNVGLDCWHFKPVSLHQICESWKAQEGGYWDANVYPDAPLSWQMEVSMKRTRAGGSIEPTLDILKKRARNIKSI